MSNGLASFLFYLCKWNNHRHREGFKERKKGGEVGYGGKGREWAWGEDGRGGLRKRKTLENGDEESMLGVTKTTHCIFLRERDCGSGWAVHEH